MMEGKNTAENNYNKMLKNFTKQSTDQYKRYEVYLKNSEELLNYCLIFFNRSAELNHKIIDCGFLRSKIDFQEHFSEEGKLKPNSAVNTAIDKFSRSQFLAKRKMFINIKKRMNLRAILKIEDLERKYSKFLNEELEKDLTSPNKYIPMPSHERNDLSITKERSFNISLNGQKTKEEPKGSCKRVVSEIKAAMDKMQENDKWFNKESLFDIIKSVDDFVSTIQTCLTKFKNALRQKTKETGKEERFDASVLNKDIERIKRELNEIEKLEYQKLENLRSQNNKLSIIQNHIKNLSVENEKLVSQINNNEFNLIVNNEIILAYENSLKKKEETLEAQERALKSIKEKSDKLNQAVSEIMNELIGTLIRLGKRG